MRVIQLDPTALEDLTYFVERDRKLAGRLLRLLAEIGRTPFEGTGKPEALRGDLSGYWSRRLNDEHRIVYRVDVTVVRVIACRYHYGR